LSNTRGFEVRYLYEKAWRMGETLRNTMSGQQSTLPGERTTGLAFICCLLGGTVWARGWSGRILVPYRSFCNVLPTRGRHVDDTWTTIAIERFRVSTGL
jgi:hypothetical protein